MSEDQLIFIISQPRSGSTLLQAVLSNNQYVDTVSESWMLLNLLGCKEELTKAKFNSKKASYAFNDFLQKTGLRNYYQTKIGELALDIYDKVKGKESKYFIDKTPRYYEILNQLSLTFPKAKYLILKRNPLDVLYSIVRTWDAIDYYKLHEYHRDILIAPFLIQDFIDRYQHDLDLLQVYYSRLTSNQSKLFFKEIFDWLDLPFSVDNLNYGANQKYKGVFGDPVSVSKKSKIISNENSWTSLLADKKWRGFVLSYISYLSQSFIENYCQEQLHYDPLKEGFIDALWSYFPIQKSRLNFHYFRFGALNGIYESRKANRLTLRNLYRFSQ